MRQWPGSGRQSWGGARQGQWGDAESWGWPPGQPGQGGPESTSSVVLLFSGEIWGQALGSLPSFTEYLLCAGLLWIFQALALLSCHAPPPPPPISPDHFTLPLPSSPANRKHSRRGQESLGLLSLVSIQHGAVCEGGGVCGGFLFTRIPRTLKGWCLRQAQGQPLCSGCQGGASSTSASWAQTVPHNPVTVLEVRSLWNGGRLEGLSGKASEATSGAPGW